MPDQLLIDAAIMLVAPEIGASLALNHLTNTFLRATFKRDESGDNSDEHLERIADALYDSQETPQQIAETVKMRVGMPDTLHISINNVERSRYYQQEQEYLWSVF